MSTSNQMNKELFNVYVSKLGGLIELINNNHDLSDPLLLSVDDRYFKAKNKIMIFGQETHGWELPKSPWPIMKTPEEFADGLMKYYASQHWTKAFKASPFWQAADMLYERLNDYEGRPDIGYLWNNVDKVDFNGNRLTESLRQEVQKCFTTLVEELKITKPDIVIFFTGDRYDAFFENLGAKLESTEKTTGINYELLAKIIWPGVLPNRSFVVNHPKQLQMKHRWDLLDVLVELCR